MPIKIQSDLPVKEILEKEKPILTKEEYLAKMESYFRS